MTDRRDLRNIVICVTLVLIGIAACQPFAEIGIDDDWTYIKTTFDLAHTGHLVYNGWAAAMLGVQAYWGALFVSLFGMHFWAARLSTLFFAPGCAVLAYALHRRAGVTPALSLFGTLTLSLSPFFLPYAATFMTETPAQFFFLLSVYAVVRIVAAIDESNITRFSGWLAALVACAVLSGTIRQVLWGFPLIYLPYLLCERRLWATRLRETFCLLAAMGATVLGALLCNRWFEAQPNIIQERVGLGVTQLFSAGSTGAIIAAATLAASALTTVVIALPALLAASPVLAKRAFHGISVRISVFYTLLCLSLAAVLSVLGNNWRFPWFGNTVTTSGLWNGTVPCPEGYVEAHPVLGDLLRTGISLAAILLFLLCAFCGIRSLLTRTRPTQRGSLSCRSFLSCGLERGVSAAFSFEAVRAVLLRCFRPIPAPGCPIRCHWIAPRGSTHQPDFPGYWRGCSHYRRRIRDRANTRLFRAKPRCSGNGGTHSRKWSSPHADYGRISSTMPGPRWKPSGTSMTFAFRTLLPASWMRHRRLVCHSVIASGHSHR